MPPEIEKRHAERHRKVMMREMTLAEALSENECDWQRFFARSNYVPFSVREGNWRKKLGWRILGWREEAAFKLAPWLRSAKALAERHLADR